MLTLRPKAVLAVGIILAASVGLAAALMLSVDDDGGRDSLIALSTFVSAAATAFYAYLTARLVNATSAATDLSVRSDRKRALTYLDVGRPQHYGEVELGYWQVAIKNLSHEHAAIRLKLTARQIYEGGQAGRTMEAGTPALGPGQTWHAQWWQTESIEHVELDLQHEGMLGGAMYQHYLWKADGTWELLWLEASADYATVHPKGLRNRTDPSSADETAAVSS